jgi:hypothetical protein
MRTILALTLVMLSLNAGPAHAFEIYGVELKLGLRGEVGGNWLPNATDLDDNDRVRPYDTFAGMGGGFGLAMQFRALNIIGLEISWLRSFDSGTAIISVEGINSVTCSPGQSCPSTEVGATLSHQADHIPILLQLTLPTGLARPFVNIGFDFVVKRHARRLELTERDPWPENLDPVEDAALIQAWDESVEARYLFEGDVNRSRDGAYAGIVGGLGVNITIKNVEIPIELRTTWYPIIGESIHQRGIFAPENSEYDPLFAAQYNDYWFLQGMLMIGLDYVIF